MIDIAAPTPGFIKPDIPPPMPPNEAARSHRAHHSPPMPNPMPMVMYI